LRAVRRGDLPYSLPDDGRPVRVAFVGQRTYFEACSMPAPAHGFHPAYVDFRGGAETAPMLDALAGIDPHVVVCFRPETLPPGALARVRAPVVGFVTEPLPRPGRVNHPNLEYNLAELARLDRANVDRVICFDALGWDTAAPLMPLWRSMPLPVDDRLFLTPRPSRTPPQVIFIGYSTMHRELSLLRLKHEHDLRHYAHALMGRELREALADADAGINLHGERVVHSFENRVLLHLAAGHLVLSERLEPLYGLEPGLDFLEVADQEDLALRVAQLHRTPDAYDRVRIRGHHKVRQYRASEMWPRVLRDLFTDLATFGTERTI
jgi:hypothetical protein